MLTEYFDAYARNYVLYKEGRWCYEDGLLYRGLEALHDATGEDRWVDHLLMHITKQIDAEGRIAGYDQSEYNIDNILSGHALLFLDRLTGDAKWMVAAERLASQLETHPRTRSNVYWHKLRYPWQVWLDGLYMGAPFQIAYGQRIGDEALVDDALTQVSTALDMAYDQRTRLYAHAVDEARKQSWANPETGHTRAHWARAIGWLTMALVDIADLVGPERFAPLQEQTVALLDRIAELRGADGLWLQVIDQPKLAGNYGETSASAMFAYSAQKAARLGIWSGADTRRWHEEMADAAMGCSDDGQLRMQNMVWVAGLGTFEGRFRDGTAEYYVSERVTEDDPKGVGPLMRSFAEHQRAIAAEPASV